MIDALRSYAALAAGLTEATAARAAAVASALVEQAAGLAGKGGDVSGTVSGLADDLLETSKENREALLATIRTEIDRAIGRVGFVREDELAALRRHVQRLETEVASLRAAGVAELREGTAQSAGAREPEPTAVVPAPEASDDAPAAPKQKTKTWIAE